MNIPTVFRISDTFSVDPRFDIKIIIDICKAILSARNSGYLPKNKIKTAKKEAQKIINGIAKIEIKRLENVINISQTNSNNYKQLQ